MVRRVDTLITGHRAVVPVVGLGAVCIVIAHDVAQGPQFLGRGQTVWHEILIWAGLGTAAAALLMNVPRRASLLLAIVLGILLRLSVIAAAPPLSDDLYRYGWDGRVQASGIDPYRYPPDSPQLARLRDPVWLWPVPGTVHGCHVIAAARGSDRTCTLINRSSVHTIYPPLAELWFTALHVSGVDRLHARGFELAGLAVDLAILAVLLSLLRDAGRDVRLVGFWALSPLPVLEYVSDGHVDNLALLLILLALLVARRQRHTAAGILVAAAALVKLYPAIVLVAVLPRGWRDRGRQVAAFAGVFVLGYLPHVLTVGRAVLGYLPGYLKEEDYTSGTRYLLLADLHLTGDLATVAVAVLLGAACLAVLWLRPDPVLGAAVLYGALLLLTTPVQPWYAVALAGVALAAGRWEWQGVGLAAYPLYMDTLTRRHDAVSVGRIAYGAALAAMLVGAGIRLWRRPSGQDRNCSSANPRIPASKLTAGA